MIPKATVMTTIPSEEMAVLKTVWLKHLIVAKMVARKQLQYAILLDCESKVEGDTKNGLDLVNALDMDQYVAPKQHTPSGGLQYIFYVDGEQAKRISSLTGLKYKGISNNMVVQFQIGLCNC